MIALIIILVLVMIFIAALISFHNEIVNLKEGINNAKGQISVQLQSRWDALSQLFKIAKDYGDFENESLTNIIGMRSGIDKNSTGSDFVKEEQKQDELFQRLQVTFEQYPELKTNELYQKSMDSLNQYEKKVNVSRMLFNDTVTKYNRKIKQFPGVLIAGSLGYEPEEYFNNTEESNAMPQF